jgi:hypothetical protein
MLTKKDLVKIKSRCDAATPGSWFGPRYFKLFKNGIDDIAQFEDAQFIANARDDIPALLDALAMQTKRADDAEAELEREKVYSREQEARGNRFYSQYDVAEESRDRYKARAEALEQAIKCIGGKVLSPCDCCIYKNIQILDWPYSELCTLCFADDKWEFDETTFTKNNEGE